MSTRRSEPTANRGRPITRRKALATGTAAAAAAAMGCPQLEDPPVVAPPSQDPCGRPARCGPRADIMWQVEASVIQVLWGDFFPRLVAWTWLRNLASGSTNPPLPPGVVTPSQLTAVINAYMSDPQGGAGPPPNPVFARRIARLIAHLGTANPIPIRYVAEGGFDFILSDAGLDLFAPPQPPTDTELLRYYEFRDPGRPTVGLARYLDEADALAFDVQAPAGPSQVSSTTLDIPVGGPGATCTLAQLTCLNRVFDEDTRRWVFTVQDYAAAVAKVRCWQLEGSVYRGIMEQLPRIVATKWREELQPYSGNGTYAIRWGNPTGMREIFKERLETSLPPFDRMVFEVRPTLQDVLVTNKGLHFPDCSDPPPKLDEMLLSISKGLAGNPVFTDTRRPPREM